MIGVQSTLRPLCFDCLIEQHEEHMSVIHAGCCVWCAKKRIEAENLEKALELAAEVEADAAELAPKRLRVERLAKSARACKCGKPAIEHRREAVCRSCDEEASERINRALPAELQRD